MILAEIAAYLLVIVLVLGLSVRFLWLFFILFTYRTLASILPFENIQKLGVENHFIYFIVILILSIGIYLLLISLTIDLPWIRFVVLGLLVIWVFKNYSFQDIFLLRDYLESKGMWNVDWYINQIKEIFTQGPDAFIELFNKVIDNVFGVFEKMFNGISGVFSKK